MSGNFFERLSKVHKRSEFHCGVKDLDDFIQKYARQNASSNLSETYVLIHSDKDIFGFYTLSAASIAYQNYPENRNLPKYGIPAALIGRLAVDESRKWQGFGKLLLVDALIRVHELSKSIGVHCVTVNAKDENARKFYQKFGFASLHDDPLHLFISIKRIRSSFTL